MANDWGYLGDLKFRLGHSPSDFRRTVAHIYTEHDRIEGKPRLQQMGDELETIDLAIQLHYNFCEPEEVLKEIEKASYLHTILDFTTGAGRYYGKFVIEQIDITMFATAEDGKPAVIELTLSLKEVSDTQQPSKILTGSFVTA